jgi:hypothetical protein
MCSCLASMGAIAPIPTADDGPPAAAVAETFVGHPQGAAGDAELSGQIAQEDNRAPEASRPFSTPSRISE